MLTSSTSTNESQGTGATLNRSPLKRHHLQMLTPTLQTARHDRSTRWRPYRSRADLSSEKAHLDYRRLRP